jgi:hypothetical protein
VELPVLSVTFATKGKDPVEAVVPAIVPVAASWMPTGKAPELTLQR